MKGINHFEYTRGLITASIIWLCFIVFLGIVDIIHDLLLWAFGNHWLRPTIFILFIIISAMLLARIGMLGFNKLTRNRFKYFPTDKMKDILGKGEEEWMKKD